MNTLLYCIMTNLIFHKTVYGKYSAKCALVSTRVKTDTYLMTAIQDYDIITSSPSHCKKLDTVCVQQSIETIQIRKIPVFINDFLLYSQ